MKLLEKGTDFDQFCKTAAFFFPSCIAEGITSIDAYIREAVHIGVLNPWHYYPLEEIMKLIFGENEKCISTLFEDYEENLNKYLVVNGIVEFLNSHDKEDLLCQSKTAQFIKHFKRNHLYHLGLKVKAPITEKSLHYVQSLWKSLRMRFSLTPSTVLLENILKACIEINWLVPTEVSTTLCEEGPTSKDFFLQEQIKIVWIDGECIYHEDIHASLDMSKVRVSDSLICGKIVGSREI